MGDSPRYVAEDTGYEFEVIDTMDGFAMLCECFDPDDAERIAKALNLLHEKEISEKKNG